MRSRLFKKFFLTTTAIFLAGITFLSVIFGIVMVNYFVGDVKRDLTQNCSAVAEAVESGNTDIEMLPRIVSAIAKTSEAEIYVCDMSGKISVCSCDLCTSGGRCNIKDRVIPATVLEKVQAGSFFENGTLDGFYDTGAYFTTGNIIKDSSGKTLGFVFSSTPSKQITSFFSTFIKMYILAAIVPITLIFFAEYALSYRLIRPLRQMSDAAKRMAKGDFSRRIPVISDDEIGDLSISFNNMTNSLAQLETMRRSFVANVSHELRTPMTTIGGFIDGILDGTIDEDMQGHYLTIVSDEIKRLSRLVESMLCLAKLESGEQKIHPRVIDVAKISRNIIISQEKRLEEKSLSVTGLDAENCTVCADYDLIYQVIFNLVDNAIKFVNQDGSIEFNIKKSNAGIVFGIKNSGSYIPKTELKNVFERFYKVDKSRSANKNGTGLGLYITKTIIDIHGGRISVNSQDGEHPFTEFCFSLIDLKEDK